MQLPPKTQEELLLEIKDLKQRIEKMSHKKGIDQLQDLVENTSEIILLISLTGRILFSNKAFKESIGYSTDELASLNIEDLLYEKHKDDTLNLFSEIKEGKHYQDVQIVLRNKERKHLYLSGDISCRFENGKPVSYRCLLRDISQRRRAENAQNLYYSIAQYNLSTQNLFEFLQQVHLELQKNLFANNFFVAIYEKEVGEIYFPYHVDEKYTIEQSQTRRKMGKGIVEYAIVKNEPLFLNKDILEKLVSSNEVYLYGPEIPAVMVVVPLKVENQTIGIIGVKSYSDPNKFSNRDFELLQFVSGQVAVALNRKKREENIFLQTARLNSIFDSSSHLIWTVRHSLKRQLSSFNKNYSDLLEKNLGIPPEINVSTEKMGWRLIDPVDRPLLKEKYNKAFAGEPQHFEMHWGNLDGGTDWYEFYLNPILTGEDGEIEEVCGIARDITPQKNALLALKNSEEKFRNIIESFIDIYYRTDLNGNINMISPSVLTHTGYSLEEVMGNKVDKFFENATDSAKGIKTLLKTGNVTNYEVNVRRKDGELRRFMLNIRMVRDKRNLPYEVEGVARDITDLKKYSEELIVAKNEAEKSLKIKEQFLANMSHEIRTPMNGVIGMIDLLNDTPLSSSQKDYVQTIRKSSETLLEILNDILDLSKIEAGKMELHPAATDLHEIINRLIALFSQRAKEKNNVFNAVICEDVPRYIMADQTRLLQILSNLTSNALKFTENGTVQVVVNKVDNENKIKFEVKDSGIGISEEGQKLLFNAFQQLDNSTKKSFGGTGLGLAISREFCKKMNGEMGVSSVEGEGSTFWFTIEAIPTNERPAEANDSKEKELTSYFTGSSPKILLVDDNAVNRKVASEILKKANCTVTTASSGKEAIATFLENSDFDVILMDIQMPEMDGVETTKRLRELVGDALPTVVAMTAYSMQNDRERFLENGMDEYIPKPIRAAILLSKLSEIIQQKTPKDKPLEVEKVVAQESHQFEVDSAIPAFDKEVVEGLKEMVGDEMLHSVYEDFKNEAIEQLVNTEKAFRDKNVKIIQAELHTLKGNSGTIGLMRIHEATKSIEEPSKTGDLSGFEEKFAILKKEFDFFIENFNSQFS